MLNGPIFRRMVQPTAPSDDPPLIIVRKRLNITLVFRIGGEPVWRRSSA